MKVLLRVNIKVIMFFSFSEELLFEFVLSFGEMLCVLKMLTPEFVHEIDVPLKKILQHDANNLFESN
jgi:hypothetical protein